MTDNKNKNSGHLVNLCVAVSIFTLGLALGYTFGHKTDSPLLRKSKSTIELKVGEIKQYHWNSICYAGMPNSNTFSMAPRDRNAVNYFYPSNSREISMINKHYEVLEVSPEKIKLRERRE